MEDHKGSVKMKVDSLKACPTVIKHSSRVEEMLLHLLPFF